MGKNGLEKEILSHTHDMENIANKTNNSTPTKENHVLLSSADALEYRAYKKQKKISEVSLAMSRSSAVLKFGEDAKRVCERAVRMRQAAVKAPLTRLLSVKDYLSRNKMRMDCMVGGDGEQVTKVKEYEIKLARKNGVSEVTVAVTPSLLQGCNYSEIKKELKKLKRAAKNISLKVWVDKKYSFPTIARIARICGEVGAQFVCVPYFEGCERLRYDLMRGCYLEVSEVETLADYKRLSSVGIGRIVTSKPWEIYTEWLKEAEKIEIGTVPPLLPLEIKKSSSTIEKTEEKPNVGGTTAQAASVMPAVKTSEETNYRCRLEGNGFMIIRSRTM